MSPSVVAINTEGGSFVDVREGDNATLECEADGIPRPSIHWVSIRVIGVFFRFDISFSNNITSYSSTQRTYIWKYF